MNGFNRQAFLTQCGLLAEKNVTTCGCVYEIYQRNLTADIEYLINEQFSDHREEAMSAAIENIEAYITPQEMKQRIRKYLSEGYCSHGLDPKQCPMGCNESK